MAVPAAQSGTHGTERLVSPPTFQLAEEAVQAARAVSRLGCGNGDLRFQLFERQCPNVVPAVDQRTTCATVMFAFHRAIAAAWTRIRVELPHRNRPGDDAVGDVGLTIVVISPPSTSYTWPDTVMRGEIRAGRTKVARQCKTR